MLAPTPAGRTGHSCNPRTVAHIIDEFQDVSNTPEWLEGERARGLLINVRRPHTGLAHT